MSYIILCVDRSKKSARFRCHLDGEICTKESFLSCIYTTLEPNELPPDIDDSKERGDGTLEVDFPFTPKELEWLREDFSVVKCQR